MPRLIDADAFEEKVKEFLGETYVGKVLVAMLHGEPAIDVQKPVRHVGTTTFITTSDLDKWQTRIIVDEGEKSRFCHVYYAGGMNGEPEPHHRPEECVYYATRQRDGRGVCLGTREVDPCDGAGCKRWKPKKDGGLANG